jgi:hypothetical protein
MKPAQAHSRMDPAPAKTSAAAALSRSRRRTAWRQRERERAALMAVVEAGPWYERIWLPLLRLGGRIDREPQD